MEEICEKYDEKRGKYEGVCGKFMKYEENMKEYDGRDWEKFQNLPLYLSFGTQENSEPFLPIL